MSSLLRFINLLILAVFTSVVVHGQNDKDSLNLKIDFNHQFRNVTFVTTGMVGLSFLLDKSSHNYASLHQRGGVNDFCDVATVFGEKTIMIPTLGVMLGAGYLFKEEELKTTSWNATKAVLVSSIMVEVMKYSLGRVRPFTNEGSSSFHPFSGEDQYKSLPSGHVSLSFALFTPFAETYSRWLYVVPTSVAFSRMYQNKHWFSDVVVGGGLGFLTGWYFTHHPSKRFQLGASGMILYF